MSLAAIVYHSHDLYSDDLYLYPRVLLCFSRPMFLPWKGASSSNSEIAYTSIRISIRIIRFGVGCEGRGNGAWGMHCQCVGGLGLRVDNRGRAGAEQCQCRTRPCPFPGCTTCRRSTSTTPREASIVLCPGGVSLVRLSVRFPDFCAVCTCLSLSSSLRLSAW